MVTFELREGMKLSAEEKQALENAKKLPVVYDEDSPELTEAMEQAFIFQTGGLKPPPFRR